MPYSIFEKCFQWVHRALDNQLRTKEKRTPALLVRPGVKQLLGEVRTQSQERSWERCARSRFSRCPPAPAPRPSSLADTRSPPPPPCTCEQRRITAMMEDTMPTFLQVYRRHFVS
jgi:hypothetical protein